MKTYLIFTFAIFFILAGCNETKSETFIAGDSLCVGVAQATNGLKSYARSGTPTIEVASQIKRIPENSTIILCAGTNDSAARLNGFSKAVDIVLQIAKERNQRIIWIGPISTSLWWDSYSDQADTYLALKNYNYVSLRSIRWNTGERASDLIHLTGKGYARLWGIVKEKL